MCWALWSPSQLRMDPLKDWIMMGSQAYGAAPSLALVQRVAPTRRPPAPTRRAATGPRTTARAKLL